MTKTFSPVFNPPPLEPEPLAPVVVAGGALVVGEWLDDPHAARPNAAVRATAMACT